VLAAEALVAEVAVDLEDPLHPADQEPLEEQLGRDPQVQVQVQGVVVGDERFGRRPAGDRLHHGRLDFEEALRVRNRRIVATISLRFRNRSMTSGLAHRST
jgi:hypothetical protein